MHVLIIGAGAAGLMAAKELAGHNLQVTVLEARERIGGRIHTLKEPFTFPAEGGAEFVHGKLKTTLNLAKEAGLEVIKMEGSFWRVEQGKWKEEETFIENEKKLMYELEKLQVDVTMADFLKENFADEKYRSMRHTLKKYIEGYDAADTTKASAMAFREERQHQQDVQFRIAGGYKPLTDWLFKKAVEKGATVHLSQLVKKVAWVKGAITLTTSKDTFFADKVLVTVPLGVLQSSPDSAAHISFEPSLLSTMKAFSRLGFGAVIKVIMQFSHPFWRDPPVMERIGKQITDLSFLLSDASIPTWWTQYPIEEPLLCGWLAGPEAAALKDVNAATLLEKAYESLSQLFQVPIAQLKKWTTLSTIMNWTADAFTLGAYTFATTHTREAKKIALEPVEDTLYFAGEALYEGSEMGTVEAALVSGKQTAATILAGK